MIDEMMQSITQSAPGGSDTLVWAAVPMPVPGERQLLVRVRAAGVNRADIVQREGKYPPPPGAPLTLGLEVAGEVAAVGSGCTRFKAGDAVLGLVAGGAYAEYALLDEDLALAKLDAWSWVEAASLPEAWMTAWFNLVEIGQLKAGETALIHAGASGVGTAAIQLAGLLGAHAIATVGSDEKADWCRNMGASSVFNYKSEPDFHQQIKAQGGADFILDCVGADYLAGNVACAKQDGRIVIIGGMSGRQAMLDIGLLLMKRVTLRGSTLRSQPLAVKARLTQALRDTIIPALQAGQLKMTIDSTYPVQAVADAHDYVEANRNLGKVVLVM
ncbi:NAD(P)H-quinone oxidoreductase [Burkholderiaceae bacterium DAT-1]|nr:NAD(P)H-quinone oxidoreductase [Burkholderiaceae bacterium DAT-1]